MKVPKTEADLNAVAALPFNEAMSIIARADGQLVEKWGRALWPNFGHGYMHSSDHHAALKVLLEREPTFREVYDSYHSSGSRNIDAARIKAGGGQRPREWDQWTAEQRRYAVLVHLYGISAGSKIFDGKRKDPSPEKTRDLLLLWGGVSELPGEPPVPTEPPKPEPPPSPAEPPAQPPAIATQLREMEARITGRLDQILARLPRN